MALCVVGSDTVWKLTASGRQNQLDLIKLVLAMNCSPCRQVPSSGKPGGVVYSIAQLNEDLLTVDPTHLLSDYHAVPLLCHSSEDLRVLHKQPSGALKHGVLF